MDPESAETVLVAGASGGTGRELLRLLAPRVPTVRALTRSSEKASSLRETGADEVVVDDLLAPEDLSRAVAGVDVVYSAVGSGLGDVRSGGPLVDGAGAQALLDAAVDAGVAAFAMESALGVGDEPASPLASLFDLVIGPVQRAKAETETALRQAPIRHTVLRPGVLTNGARTDQVTVARPGARLWGAVSRADVARLLAAAPVTPAAEDETFEVVATPRFRDRALDVDWQLPHRPPDSS
ncbi:MAG: NAD(P)-binding oxidoreductase [Haloferacaceae archaeon]